MPDRPNIVFFHVDNLGMVELGCYGGGVLRGADTGRAEHTHNAVREFEESAAREQLIPAGAPPDVVPETGGAAGV